MSDEVGNSTWTEANSATFLEYGPIFTPRRGELEDAFLSLIPADEEEGFVGVDVGCGSGWLSEAVLRRFPRAEVIALDGSPAMLEHARRRLDAFEGRVKLELFRLEDAAWPSGLREQPRCFLSNLAIHHLDDAAKAALFRRLSGRLESGGALLLADLVRPQHRRAWEYAARSWTEDVRRQSLEISGGLGPYEEFIAQKWNYFEYPDDDPSDKPSTLPSQLRWLQEAGLRDVDVFWARSGHALFGGYK